MTGIGEGSVEVVDASTGSDKVGEELLKDEEEGLDIITLLFGQNWTTLKPLALEEKRNPSVLQSLIFKS